MQYQLSTFCFNSNPVRAITINDAPWFVAADVCAVLEIQNPSDALKRLDCDERARFNLGRQGEAAIINESGLYSLILGSRKPEAKKFKKWVTAEVLPAIRKNGKYETAPAVTNGEAVTRSLESLDALRFQRAITMAIENGQRIIGQFPAMSPAEKQGVVIDLVNDAAGRQVITRQASEFINAYQASLAVDKMSDNEIRQAFGHNWRACSGVLSQFAFDATQAALKAEELSDRVLVACRRAAA